MSKTDWMKYKDLLENCQQINLKEEIDEQVDKLHNTIKQAINQTTPIMTYRTLPSNKPNEELKRLQVQYNNIRTFIEQTGPTRELLRNIREIQQGLQEEYRQINNEKWNNLIKNIDTTKDPKNFWQNINKLLGTKKQTINYIKDQNGHKLYTDHEKEEAFRREWKKIFRISEDENESFDKEHEELIKEWLREQSNRLTPYHTGNPERLRPNKFINHDELLHCLRRFKEKSPGMSGITRNMLLNLPNRPMEALINIYNSTFSAGYFPIGLKRAKMIFIPKEGKDPKQIINYRPISLLEITGKLDKFLVNHNKLNPRQHGFRRGRGTHTAIAIITEIIAKEKQQRNQVNIVLRDVAKAFDKVWHNGLTYKILNLDLPAEIERILCDYLQNRTAQLQIGNHLGPTFDLESGVPQGGVLSPTLFSIYTRNLPEPTQHSEHIIFADDITQIISYPGKSEAMMARKTALAIKNINDYEKKWKIRTNTNKFKIIPIAKIKVEPVIVDGEIYPYTNEGSILGLKITKNGYQSFIAEKVHNLRSKLSKIRRLKNLNIPNKRKLYTALIKSVMCYPPVPTNSFSATRIKKLQTVQNKSLRYIYNISYEDRVTNEELHRRANIKAVNVDIYNQAKRTWEQVRELDSETVANWLDNEPVRRAREEHAWFRLSRIRVNNPPPIPKYN